MRNRRLRTAALALGAVVLWVAAAQAGGRNVTDMAGRTVALPAKVSRVFCVNPIAATILYTLAPDRLLGWNFPLRPEEKRFLPRAYAELPVLGGWFSTQKGNVEEILKHRPDLFLHMGPLDASTRSLADRLQEQAGIPVVVLDYELTRLDRTYAFLGKLLGETKRAEALGAYCRETLRDVADKARGIPREKRVRVYYAEGPKGLQTEPSGSRQRQILDLVGATNVAEVPQGGLNGMSAASLEQIHLWDPDLILAWGTSRGGAYDGILSDPNWKTLRAVANRRVYAVPDNPFCWFDRPPGVNRLLGVRWAAALIYPEVFRYDLVKEAQRFYRLFWRYDLTAEEARDILRHSVRKE